MLKRASAGFVVFPYKVAQKDERRARMCPQRHFTYVDKPLVTGINPLPMLFPMQVEATSTCSRAKGAGFTCQDLLW